MVIQLKKKKKKKHILGCKFYHKKKQNTRSEHNLFLFLSPSFPPLTSHPTPTHLGVSSNHLLIYFFNKHSVNRRFERTVESDYTEIFKIFQWFTSTEPGQSSVHKSRKWELAIIQAARKSSSLGSLHWANFSKNLSSRGTKISPNSLLCIFFL